LKSFFLLLSSVASPPEEGGREGDPTSASLLGNGTKMGLLLSIEPGEE